MPAQSFAYRASHGSVAQTTSDHRTSHVSVSAVDVLPLLIDAALTNRAWLDDFAQDTLDIPRDLYEVLLAYRSFRSESA